MSPSVPSAGALSGFDIAIIAATISILLGGILYGVGLGFGVRRIRLLGAEEIGQGIISAAMVGAFIAFAALLDSTAASLLPSQLPPCPQIASPASSPHAYYACSLAGLEQGFSSLGAALARTASIAGFASSLQISLGVVSAQPLFALEEASRSLSSLSSSSYALSSLAFLERSLDEFIRASALAVFLPAGLVLRCFFATRRLGAAAMAVAISAYAVFPLFFLYSFPQSQSLAACHSALSEAEGFNSDFASVPLMELDETSSVRGKLDEMSQGDFGSRLQPMFPLASNAGSLALLDLALFPLLSLAISIVAALEIYRLLCAPIFLPYFDKI
jgi:hypothetical protein